MQLATPAAGHQLCLAHLLRELKAMGQEHPGEHWPAAVKTLFMQALQLKQQPYSTTQVQEIEQQLHTLLLQEQTAAPGKIPAFWKRMVKHADKIFTFLHHPDVPPDNNASERAIRNVKVKQKVSGQFKTEDGAKQYAMFRSIIDSLTKQGKNIHEALVQIAKLVPQ